MRQQILSCVALLLSCVSTFSAGALPSWQSGSNGNPLDRFVGEWNGRAEAAQVVESAIERVTSRMNMFERRIARNRLQARNKPPARIRMDREDRFFVIAFGAATVHRLPLSGEAVQQGEAKLRIRVEQAPEVVLHHIGETTEGRRENTFRVDASSGVLTMNVIVTSPQLPAPVQYSLQFTGAPARPPTAAGS
jgi:hypothetical protein